MTKWLRKGDKNTKFFHPMTSTRRRVNLIDKLFVHSNVVVTSRELKKAIADHFESDFNQNHAIQLKEWVCNFKTLNEESVRSLER